MTIPSCIPTSSVNYSWFISLSTFGIVCLFSFSHTGVCVVVTYCDTTLICIFPITNETVLNFISHQGNIKWFLNYINGITYLRKYINIFIIFKKNSWLQGSPCKDQRPWNVCVCVCTHVHVYVCGYIWCVHTCVLLFNGDFRLTETLPQPWTGNRKDRISVKELWSQLLSGDQRHFSGQPLSNLPTSFSFKGM